MARPGLLHRHGVFVCALAVTAAACGTAMAAPALAGGSPAAAKARPAVSPLARVTPRTQPALEAALTEALDTGRRGRWNDEVEAYSGDVIPGAARSGGCRVYSYTVVHGAQRWTSPARTACRDEEGGWRLR